MTDFSELEEQLRKLRPLAASEDLIARVEHALGRPANYRKRRSPRQIAAPDGSGCGVSWNRLTEFRLASVWRQRLHFCCLHALSWKARNKGSVRLLCMRQYQPFHRGIVIVPQSLFPQISPRSFTTLGTKDCFSHLAPISRCGVCARKNARLCDGAIRRQALRCASRIRVRKSLSFQFRANDLFAAQNYEKKPDHSYRRRGVHFGHRICANAAKPSKSACSARSTRSSRST